MLTQEEFAAQIAKTVAEARANYLKIRQEMAENAHVLGIGQARARKILEDFPSRLSEAIAEGKYSLTVMNLEPNEYYPIDPWDPSDEVVLYQAAKIVFDYCRAAGLEPEARYNTDEQGEQSCSIEISTTVQPYCFATPDNFGDIVKKALENGRQKSSEVQAQKSAQAVKKAQKELPIIAKIIEQAQAEEKNWAQVYYLSDDDYSHPDKMAKEVLDQLDLTGAALHIFMYMENAGLKPTIKVYHNYRTNFRTHVITAHW